MNIQELNKLLGNIDIYLLDQILKGRFDPKMKILDAGCGEGRNLVYFLHGGYSVFGIDQNPVAIQMVRAYAKSIRNDYDLLRFQKASIEDIPFHKEAFDVILSSAVLHFAKNKEHFMQMVGEMIRVLKPGGIFWCRMTTGVTDILTGSTALGNGIYLLPDGTERFLLTDGLLAEVMDKYSLTHLETPKSVLLPRQRAMGVFLFQKQI